jgi:hypothetical protein
MGKISNLSGHNPSKFKEGIGLEKYLIHRIMKRILQLVTKKFRILMFTLVGYN